MTEFNMRSLAVALAIATIVVISGQWAQAEVCNGDLIRLRIYCKQFCLNAGPLSDPSTECCNAIKIADLPCVCENSSPLTDNVSLEKVAYMWKFCGRPLRSGMKCADFTIPEA